MNLAELQVVSYELEFDASRNADVRLEMARGVECVRWAIRDHGACLNKKGEWEYEPMPSSRDDAFFERCRWDSAEEALAFWQSSGVRSRFSR